MGWARRTVAARGIREIELTVSEGNDAALAFYASLSTSTTVSAPPPAPRDPTTAPARKPPQKNPNTTAHARG